MGSESGAPLGSANNTDSLRTSLVRWCHLPSPKSAITSQRSYSAFLLIRAEDFKGPPSITRTGIGFWLYDQTKAMLNNPHTPRGKKPGWNRNCHHILFIYKCHFQGQINQFFNSDTYTVQKTVYKSKLCYVLFSPPLHMLTITHSTYFFFLGGGGGSYLAQHLHWSLGRHCPPNDSNNRDCFSLAQVWVCEPFGLWMW